METAESQVTTETREKRKPLNPNRVRDHLANERTYLAWMRSGIALMGLGVVIVRLRILRPPLAPQAPGNGWKLGLTFSLVGMVMVLFSSQHYFQVQRDIEEDTYQPDTYWVLLSTAAILLLGVGVLYYVFTLPLDYTSSILIE